MKEQPLLKLGYKASAEQFGPRELLEFSCLAEEVGFDSVFVSDHFQPWKHTGGHAPNSLAWLGALGAKTRRVQIGTSVATPTFRYHPSIVAQAFGTLGAMFPDRVVLGLGTGESLNEVPATGIEWPGAKERRDRLREAVRLINKLWTEDRARSPRASSAPAARTLSSIPTCRARSTRGWQRPAAATPISKG
jgi:coenzyme F420-dependent glucose-6-phosphate dehydrogenase